MTNDKLKIKNEGKNIYNITPKAYHHLTFVIGHLTLLFFLCIFMVSCAPKPEESLKTVKVQRGTILAEIPSTGSVMPRNRLEIKPPIAGRIDQVIIKEGQSVKKGEILAWMSSTERAALMDAARTKGESEVKHWEEVYRPAPIIAPLTGFIIQRNIEAGQSITTNDAVLVMADRLIVKAQVDETDIGRIQTGQRVKIELDAYPGQEISGIVEHIAYESKVVNNVTIYEVDLLPSNVPPFFRSGMSATVNFRLNIKKDILTLPLRVVKKVNGHTYVFIKQAGHPQLQPIQIETGLENSRALEIISGLSENDEVVIPTTKMIQNTLQKDQRRGPMNPFTKQE